MFAAVVVLFNPGKDIIENIESYKDFVSKIYIIDNSQKSNEYLFLNLTYKNKLKYIHNSSNLGIAKALNIGCQMAIDDSNRWVLTMDQDSKFLNLNPQIFSSIMNNKDDKIALYYPKYLINGLEFKKNIIENEKPIVVMTSGNIINLNVFNTIERFDEKLFIDYVDYDYCLKLKKFGYKISNLQNTFLTHELGQSRNILFCFLKLTVTNHSSLRRYYITRNRLYVLHKYKNISKIFYKKEKKVFVNDILKIIIFENDKLLKIKSIIRGYLDYKKNVYGKF